MASPSPLPRPDTVPPPASRGGPAGKKPSDPLDPYHRVAETVGMVPSLRVKDNVVQAVIVIAGLLIGGGIGGIIAANQNFTWWYGVLGGAAAGMIVATFLSGAVLMVIGWFRSAKR